MADDIGFSLDLNERYTRIAQIRPNNNQLELEALGFELTAPFYYSSDNQAVIEKEAQVIAKLHSTLKIRRRNAHIIIPDVNTFSRIIEMPKLKEKELLAAIRYQADEFIPMNIDDTNLDLEILKEDPKTNKVLIFIVASPKKLVEKIQTTIELADLIPETLENELSAVARMISTFLRRAPAKQMGTTILLNFGYTSSSLYLFDETNSVILLSRSFNIGLDLFIKDIIANLNIDEAKASEALRTMGANPNASLNLDAIITPIIKQINREIDRFILISKDKYGLPVTEIYSFNFDNTIASFNQKLQAGLSLPIHTLTLDRLFYDNPLKKSFSNTLSSFISVIAGSI
jgi:type IV pilus assembly protein PilM